MGSRIWTTIASLLLVLPAAAWSQAPGLKGLAPQARVALVESSPKGAAFKSGGQTYQVVGGLRATGGRGTPEERLTSVGVAPSDLVEERGPFLIYKAGTGAAGAKVSAMANAVNRSQTFPVVVNTRTGRLGVAANVLIVRLTSVAQAAALAEASGLTLDFVAERLGIAFFTVPDGRDIQSAAAALAKDPRVKSAEVEVREYFAVPM